MTWHACTHDWPVGDPLDPETVRKVVAEFDEHHDAAVRSLADTEIDEEEP